MQIMNDDLPQDLGNRFGDLSDLPESLIKQIPSARTDEVEQQIIDLLRMELEGVASVDEVLVGLFRKTGTVHDRKKLSSKLYRMVNSRPQLLVAIERKRGVYRLP